MSSGLASPPGMWSASQRTEKHGTESLNKTTTTTATTKPTSEWAVHTNAHLCHWPIKGKGALWAGMKRN